MLKSIVLLYSLINTGDVSHGKSIVEKLTQKDQTEVMLIDANLPENELQAEYQKIKSKLKADESMILAIGEKGLLALSTLNKTQHFQDSKVQLGASLHMYFDVIETLPLDFLAIPETELKKGSIKKIPHSVLTLTVPSKNPTQEELKIAYDNWEIATTKKPSTQNSYIVVMLPGDAVDQNGKMKYFTKESAKQLFDNIVTLRNKHGKKHTVIVQNGPRTGKFNPENGAILCAHEYEKGHNPDIAIDSVSQYFIKLLEQEAISHYFFNFAFEIDGKAKKALSVFNQLLYIAQSKNDNFFIVPGESVTMLGQIPLYLEPKQVIVFKPDSMNTSHEAIFEVIKNRGHLSYFSDQNTVLAPKHSVKMQNDDAATVTKGLVKVFTPENPSFFSKINNWLKTAWNSIHNFISNQVIALKNKFTSKSSIEKMDTLSQAPIKPPAPTAPSAVNQEVPYSFKATDDLESSSTLAMKPKKS